jgi:hypothetical protein
MGSMKTTIDIPDDSLRDLMVFTKAGTKRAAVVQAVEDFNRRQKMARLTKYAGTFKDFIVQEDLGRMREEGKKPW